MASESTRLAALHRSGILDTVAEADFDMLCDAAAGAYDCPIAAVSFVDNSRQWFKAARGLDQPYFLRSESLCVEVLELAQPLLVPQTTKHAALCSHPLVLGSPKVRFYAGAPIVCPTTHCVLGSIFVLDTKPHIAPSFGTHCLQILATEAARLATTALPREKLHRNAFFFPTQEEWAAAKAGPADDCHDAHDFANWDAPARLQLVRRRNFQHIDLRMHSPPALDAAVVAASLIDESCQRFILRGKRYRVPKSQALCAHVVRTKAPVWVSDTTVDARFRDHPWVTGVGDSPFSQPVRFFASIPIFYKSQLLGTVFAVDYEPRVGSFEDWKALNNDACPFASAIEVEMSVKTPLMCVPCAWLQHLVHWWRWR
ncbi:hypothetical protein ACHHYP_07784 [Achlya hypogyna]|uniref:GAF domain-containing protein n=1 Tax=Achlya hypogyna TaxID=1202772 RepID=A0A1V9YQA6_ACHHY|nr:hypothetical protein ACHHYP_07784 [Achlya hypogyna]